MTRDERRELLLNLLGTRVSGMTFEAPKPSVGGGFEVVLKLSISPTEVAAFLEAFGEHVHESVG
jgi:hypothetical protein